MSNILDYISWRGDLTFEQDSFNEIDALVLSQIAYLGFDGLIEKDKGQSLPLSVLWETFKSAADFEKRSDPGVVINANTVKVLEGAANSKRFGDVRAAGFVNNIDLEREEQFSAVTFLLSCKKNKMEDPFVVFRGTDDTIVGWKEDFNLALAPEVPSQIDAVKYVDEAAGKYKGKLRIAGHSKGGNLAVYGGVFLKKGFRKRLEAVYNYDGPGFTSKVMDTPEYRSALPKIQSYYPQLSIVGMFFDHQDEFTVVESVQHGMWQHDAMSWQVEGKGFKTCESLDPKSLALNKIINTWLKQLSQQKIEKIIDSVFAVFEATGALTNSELESDLLGNTRKMIHALGKIDAEVRNEAGELLKIVFDSLIDSSYDNGLFRK